MIKAIALILQSIDFSETLIFLSVGLSLLDLDCTITAISSKEIMCWFCSKLNIIDDFIIRNYDSVICTSVLNLNV